MSNRNPPECLAFISNLLIDLPWGWQAPLNRSRTGIYFLCDRGSLVYVGKTSAGPGRVFAHLGHKRFDAAFFLQLWKKDLLPHILGLHEMETAFIQFYSPALNGGHQAMPGRRRDTDVVLARWFGPDRKAEAARLMSVHGFHSKGEYLRYLRTMAAIERRMEAFVQ